MESKTREKLAVIAGPEFGDLEGHTLVVYKALYGTCTGGNRFAEKLADDPLDMGFFQSQVDPAIWMKNCGSHYVYQLPPPPECYLRYCSDRYGEIETYTSAVIVYRAMFQPWLIDV